MTPSIATSSDHLQPSDRFAPRHLGPRPEEQEAMLSALGLSSMTELLFEAIPDAIRNDDPLNLRPAASESEAASALRQIMSKNHVLKSAIGAGYHNCLIPSVIERTVFRNPGWYTQYTPYQAEISQGRMEVLLAWQTMIADLCGLPLAGASLLDEPTAAAEAMAMARNIARGKGNVFLLDAAAHPQTIAVILGRAVPMGIEVRVLSPDAFDFDGDVFGCLVQMPNTNGKLQDHAAVADAARAAGAVSIAAVDPLLLTLMRSPGEMGFEIAVGSAQRFGVPMGFGGPHAGFLATQSNHVRRMPGRIIGVSRDAEGRPALRLTVQTREQHIRRDKATSNICTSQVLLAVMSGFYGIWHGPEGLTEIAKRVRDLA
ncbi:MAG: glycine dehydrogenase (aminomethyl-transferring), partial [Planctomycetota bacterium]|nr:glycine dehydrogenase (aminomethyl-transferring) [Planctomycetota bacterium]